MFRNRNFHSLFVSMGLTKDYLRFLPQGVCNIAGSSNGSVQNIDGVSCAVSACEYVNFFNMRTSENVGRIGRENKVVTDFRLNYDKSLLAIGYDDGEVHLHNRKSSKFSSKGSLYPIWDSGSDVIVFAGHRVGVNYLAFTDDGLTLASGGKVCGIFAPKLSSYLSFKNGTIIIWDIASESGRFRLNGHKGSITQLKFTRDGRYLVSRFFIGFASGIMY